MNMTLQIIGLLMGVIAAGFIFFGATNVPWEMQSWSGNSESEVSFRRRIKNFARWGFILLGLSFLAQLISLLWH